MILNGYQVAHLKHVGYYHEDSHKELYNLKDDIGEKNDLALQKTEKTEQLYGYLFDYLKETGALFPEKDPEYDAAKEKEHLQKMKNEKMTQLEENRIMILSKDFDPQNNWWGSQIND